MQRLQDVVLEFLRTLEGTHISTANIAPRLKTDEFVHGVYDVVEGRLAEGGSVMPDVWDLFLGQSQQFILGEEALGRWQHAIEALMAYAFQAFLAPGRPEFQKIKGYSGYYRQHIGDFIASEAILGRLGYYKPQPDATVFNQRLAMPGNEVINVVVAMLILEQELELVRRVMRRAVNEGLPVGLNVILAAKCQPHSSLEAFWNAVRHHPSVRPISTQATNASSVVPNSPGRILPEELPAPARTRTPRTFTFDEGGMDELVNTSQDPALRALLAPRHDDAMRPERLPTTTGDNNSALSGHDTRSSQGTPQRPDHWQCDDIDCQANNPWDERQCIRCGRLAYWIPLSPDDLGQASNGVQPLTGFPPVEQVAHPPRTTTAASGGVMSSQAPTYWNCSHCTAENSYDDSKCLVCHREAFWITAPHVADATHTPPSTAASGTATSRPSPHAPPITAAIRTTSSHPSTHTPLTATDRMVATPSHMSTDRMVATPSHMSTHTPPMPNRWMCRNCATENSSAESTCRQCDVESFLITVSPVGVGVDSSRRIELDGPVAQRMHSAREECPECMFPISPGEECPTCRKYTYGSTKDKKTLLNPRNWF